MGYEPDVTISTHDNSDAAAFLRALEKALNGGTPLISYGRVTAKTILAEVGRLRTRRDAYQAGSNALHDELKLARRKIKKLKRKLRTAVVFVTKG